MDTARSVSMTVRSSSVASRRTAYPVFLPLQNMVHAGSSSGGAWVSRMMRAPAGFPSLRSRVRLEREVDDEAGQYR